MSPPAEDVRRRTGEEIKRDYRINGLAVTGRAADKPATMGLTEDEIFGLFDIRSRPKRHAG
ncbi:MAG: hypothetical protein K2X82_21065 [Gemmataceae bacterium]|nr:hypothetical protein [Gemmataceae bacterium]